jgi:hypothetical protein
MLTDTIIQPLEGVTMTRFCPKCQAETERNKKGDCKPCEKIRAMAYRAKNKNKIKEYRLENANRINSEKRAWAAANKEKVKSRNLNFRKENPEKIRAISMNYRKENHDKVLISTKLWRFENPEKVKEYSKEYAAKNAESRRIWQQNRRARQLKNGDKLSKGLAQKLFKLQKGKCPCCKQLLGDDYHLDHIVPLALGGSNTDDNIQLLRATCNNQKSAKHPIDFMQQKGFLL